MFGFNFLYNADNLSFVNKEQGVQILHEDNKWYCSNMMTDKFAYDKVFYENDSYLIVLDGIVLNKTELVSTKGDVEFFGDTAWFTFLLDLYKTKGDTFFSILKGSFSGLLYDKEKDKAIVFTDHIGSRFIYYVKHKNSCFVSSMISDCFLFLQSNNIDYSLSRNSAYLLLTYGYMVEDYTLCENIKKIAPGCYITIEKGNVTCHRYFLLDNEPDNTITESDAIDLMDFEFRRAIELEFKKDTEYGYKHIVTLSGGLDSRMVSWVAHDMGYTNQLNLTFSQTGYYDETIPQEIIRYLNHDWIFKSLDGGKWLQDVDVITEMTGGNVVYYGQAHENSLVSLIDFSDLGIWHSGQIGDVAFSSSFGDNFKDPYVFGAGAYSTGLLDRIKDAQIFNNPYPNRELAQLYHRSFGANYYSYNNLYNRTEAYSPFQDYDLLNNCFKIPVRYRKDYNLYYKWIIKKYPEAAKFIWANIGCRIDRKFGLIKRNGHSIPVEQIPYKILCRLGIMKAATDSKKNMNPYGYYLNTNPELRLWMDKFYKDNIDLIPYEDLRNDIIKIFQSDNSLNKIQAISLLSAVKIFFK